MLHGIVLQASLACPRCHQPVHLQGFSEVVVCGACQSSLELPAERWLGWFGPAEIAEAYGLEEGEGRQISSLGGSSAQYAYGRRMPRCQECKTVVPAQELPALAAAGGWSCPCGQRIAIRPATTIAGLIVPGARWLVNEGCTGAEGAEPHSANEPVMFACMSCGGALRVDGSTRTVDCQYCSGSNYLPDGLWLRLHPQTTVRTFFVVTELDDTGASVGGAAELPAELLIQLARSEQSSVREAAAAQPGLPTECFERLAADDDYDVRAIVAANPFAPVAVLEGLVDDEDDDVRQALARNPALPEAALVRLLYVTDSDVRLAAVSTGRAPAEALLVLAKRETDSDVLKAIAEQPLTPELLGILAGKRGRWARRIAAQHPETPAVALGKLVESPDRVVLTALAQRPVAGPGTPLPKAVVLKLGKHSDEKIAGIAQARPDYIEAAAEQRARTVWVVGVSLALLVAVAGIAWASS